jgi:hypothetical protein
VAGTILGLVLGILGTAAVSTGEPAEPGAIGGRLVFCSGAVESLRVSIEGHPQSARSGPSGVFELTNLPPGTFDVTIEAEGYRATISNIQVEPGRRTDLGAINLTDTAADAEHCGGCNKRCPPGAACVYGHCICSDSTRIVCGDTCTDLFDLDHCRACFNRCTAWTDMTPRCEPHDCVFQCVEGTADCDSRRTTGCETRIDSDPKNCGACGNVCAPGLRCAGSRCQ